MQVLMVAQDFPPGVGGIQTYAFELAQRLVARCERFAVIAPDVRGAWKLDARLPFRVHRTVGPPDAFPFSAIPVLARVALGERGFYSLHTQWPSALTTLPLRRAGVVRRVFVAAHGRELLLRPWEARPQAQRAYDRGRSAALRGADAVFAVSRYTAELVHELGVEPGRIQVISGGTDPHRFLPLAADDKRREIGFQDAFVFLTVGRLVPRKGIDVCIEALARVRSTFPRAALVVAGEGADRDRLRSLASVLGVADRVRFVGAVDASELPSWYNAADCFVMPARGDGADVEGFGIVFLEAGACGKPVIGPMAGGAVDAIVPEVTGLLVDPLDPESVAAAMRRLMREPGFARALGMRGRERVLAGACWDHVADRLLKAMAGAPPS